MFRELVDTPDGGIFSLDWTPTKDGLEQDETPTLLVLHGLTGGSDESYIRCLLELVCYFIVAISKVLTFRCLIGYISSFQLPCCSYE